MKENIMRDARGTVNARIKITVKKYKCLYAKLVVESGVWMKVCTTNEMRRTQQGGKFNYYFIFIFFFCTTDWTH